MKVVLSYIRYPFAVILCILSTAFWSAAMLIAAPFRSRRAEQWIIRHWGRMLLLFFNIHAHVEGTENIPDQGVLFLFNHSSLFDIPIVHAATNKICRFGAKVELFRIPLFAQAMRVAGALPIARSNRAQVFKVYHEAERRFASGESFILAPEGTRQTLAEIGPFKTGPFVFAVNSKVPIVPIVIVGAIDIMHKKSLLINWGVWRKDVYVRYLEPVVPDTWDLSQVEALQKRVRANMEQAFHQMRREWETSRQFSPKLDVLTTKR